MDSVCSRSFWRSSRAFWVLALLCALTLFFRLGSYGLVDADEGRYAEIPREMLARGDWVTPTMNGVKFFDKPVLLYWSVMASFRALGETEFAARLPMALFALAGIGATYALGRRAFGPRAGWLGAAILATTFMWPIMGRVVITDTPLASLTTCALATWWLGHTETSKRKAAWFAAFWAFLGLGVLAKGPVAGVLCFGAIVPYLLWCRPQNGWQMGFIWGIPLLLCVAAPWFVVVQARNEEFNHLFWWTQNFQRFTGGAGVPDHWEKPTYFLPFLPLVFFPWSPFFPRAMVRLPAMFRRVRNDAGDEPARAVVFLVCGALFVFAFFSASKSKIVTYILPMLPLGSALLGAWFDKLWTRGQTLRAETAVVGALALVLGAVALAATSRMAQLVGTSAGNGWLYGLGILALLWAAALYIATRRGETRAIFAATSGGFALFLAAALLFWGAIENQFTLRALVAPISRNLTSDTRIVSIVYAQSLPFYSKERVILPGGAADVPRELRPGWEQLSPAEREEFFPSNPATLIRMAKQSAPMFVVARTGTLRDSRWKSLAPQLQRLGANFRYELYGNPSATQLYVNHAD